MAGWVGIMTVQSRPVFKFVSWVILPDFGGFSRIHSWRDDRGKGRNDAMGGTRASDRPNCDERSNSHYSKKFHDLIIPYPVRFARVDF